MGSVSTYGDWLIDKLVRCANSYDRRGVDYDPYNLYPGPIRAFQTALGIAMTDLGYNHGMNGFVPDNTSLELYFRKLNDLVHRSASDSAHVGEQIAYVIIARKFISEFPELLKPAE